MLQLRGSPAQCYTAADPGQEKETTLDETCVEISDTAFTDVNNENEKAPEPPFAHYYRQHCLPTSIPHIYELFSREPEPPGAEPHSEDDTNWSVHETTETAAGAGDERTFNAYQRIAQSEMGLGLDMCEEPGDDEGPSGDDEEESEHWSEDDGWWPFAAAFYGAMDRDQVMYGDRGKLVVAFLDHVETLGGFDQFGWDIKDKDDLECLEDDLLRLIDCIRARPLSDPDD